MEFGKEVIDTFEPDIVVLMNAATGEFLKAVLIKGKFACALCTTMAHKNLVMNNLKDWAKRID